MSVMIALVMKWNYALALPEVPIDVNTSSMIGRVCTPYEMVMRTL